MGRPGEIHNAAGDRLRSLRDSLVSLPWEGHMTLGTDKVSYFVFFTAKCKVFLVQ